MNIYLDIDGVLLVNEKYAAAYADELIVRLLEEFPDSTYWLSTHYWKGEKRTKEVLSGALKPETLELLAQIKPTEWGEAKTDGIDFSQKFLWLDDDLWPEELEALEKHNATDNFIMIDLNKNPNQLKDILDTL